MADSVHVRQHRPANRLLVVMPTWVGDAVMATPTLRALRALYPDAHITAMCRPMVRPIIDASPWVDRIVMVRARRKGKSDLRRVGPISMIRRISAGKFDTAVLLPNSFRAALLVRMAGIPRRVGYDRDGRGFMLTDLLEPLRTKGRFIPVPTKDYYLGVARYLGAKITDESMELFTRPDDDVRAAAMLTAAGVPENKRIVLTNPGANYGDAKMWMPERFAAVADRCTRELDAVVCVTGAPKERAILDRVIASAKERIVDLTKFGMDLTLLKSVMKRSSLLVTNDTGPRHIAAALGVPVVTVFGPTDPAWTEIHFEQERQVMVKVPCGPCQKKKCPLKGTSEDHVCMKRIDPDMVFTQARELVTKVGVP